jgi:transposase
VSRLAVQRVFAMDEARFGLKVTHRRLWCPFGSRPPWPHEHQYQWFWLYAAVEPVSGTCFVLFLPHVDGICFQRFLEELRKHIGSDTVGLVLDNSGSHTSGKVHWPDGISKIALPPYSPELNPAERWFEALRRIFANAIFDGLGQFPRRRGGGWVRQIALASFLPGAVVIDFPDDLCAAARPGCPVAG